MCFGNEQRYCVQLLVTKSSQGMTMLVQANKSRIQQARLTMSHKIVMYTYMYINQF